MEFSVSVLKLECVPLTRNSERVLDTVSCLLHTRGSDRKTLFVSIWKVLASYTLPRARFNFFYPAAVTNLWARILYMLCTSEHVLCHIHHTYCWVSIHTSKIIFPTIFSWCIKLLFFTYCVITCRRYLTSVSDIFPAIYFALSKFNSALLFSFIVYNIY